ncbi:MAG: helix-turn-helix transcriptional regulator [Eubacteriales bacterium]
MIEVSNRLKELRSQLGISQVKMATLVGCTPARINRYENNDSEAPHDILLWYANYFDVSLDYIFSRTDNPKGTTYEAIPKYTEDSSEYKKFIEMCFDPKSPMHERLKQTMLNMVKEEEN